MRAFSVCGYLKGTLAILTASEDGSGTFKSVGLGNEVNFMTVFSFWRGDMDKGSVLLEKQSD